MCSLSKCLDWGSHFYECGHSYDDALHLRHADVVMMRIIAMIAGYSYRLYYYYCYSLSFRHSLYVSRANFKFDTRKKYAQKKMKRYDYSINLKRNTINWILGKHKIQMRKKIHLINLWTWQSRESSSLQTNKIQLLKRLMYLIKQKLSICLAIIAFRKSVPIFLSLFKLTIVPPIIFKWTVKLTNKRNKSKRNFQCVIS